MYLLSSPRLTIVRVLILLVLKEGEGRGEDEGGVGVTRPGVWSLLILPPPRRTPRIKGGELQAAGYGSALVGKGRVS